MAANPGIARPIPRFLLFRSRVRGAWSRDRRRIGDWSCGFAVRWAVVATLSLMAAGCATAPLERSGSLASYDNLTPSDGLLTKSQVSISKADVLEAKTLRIEPAAFTVAAAREPVLG